MWYKRLISWKTIKTKSSMAACEMICTSTTDFCSVGSFVLSILFHLIHTLLSFINALAKSIINDPISIKFVSFLCTIASNIYLYKTGRIALQLFRFFYIIRFQIIGFEHSWWTKIQKTRRTHTIYNV